MLFKPLAHASTLDRHSATAAARLRGGVLEPGARLFPKNRRQKQPSCIQRQLPRFGERGPFSLGRGLDLALGFLQAEHHLLASCRFARERRRRPSRVALASSCHAARRLAEAPPSEGHVIAAPQEAERLLPARRQARGGCRGRAKCFDVGVSHQHSSVPIDARTIDEACASRKSNLQNPDPARRTYEQ
jgi:hypothetical protein